MVTEVVAEAIVVVPAMAVMLMGMTDLGVRFLGILVARQT